MDRIDSPNCTELEMHVINHFRNKPGWSEDGWVDMAEDEHCLQEFLHGYKNEPDAYASSDEELVLIKDCVRILEADIDGQFEYNAKDCETVIKALETFGL